MSGPEGPRRRLSVRTQLVLAVLLAALGFAAVVQVRSQHTETALSGARQQDLVGILDDVSERSVRLQGEERQLQSLLTQLGSGNDSSQAALADARSRIATLGVLAGTVAAQGPGIDLTVADPAGKVDASALLDAVEELRDAGAEAMQLNGVRVVAATAFTGGAAAVSLGGVSISPPYDLRAIGDPQTMAAALGIPGGVLASLSGDGASGLVTQHDLVHVDAVREVGRG